jgi:hypothetical protein
MLKLVAVMVFVVVIASATSVQRQPVTPPGKQSSATTQRNVQQSSQSQSRSQAGTPTPARKGEGTGHVHPDYPTAPAPDARSNGRWMVYAVGEEGTRYFVTCWRDSDQGTFREVDIDVRTYRAYLRNQDTGSIPCPRS